MDTPQDQTGARPGPKDGRAERLLGHLRKALSHDLPNQLVAGRGLLRMLQLEEGERLGPDGMEYLRRADGAARRAQALVTGLKELARLGCDVPAAEAVALDELAREVT